MSLGIRKRVDPTGLTDRCIEMHSTHAGDRQNERALIAMGETWSSRFLTGASLPALHPSAIGASGTHPTWARNRRVELVYCPAVRPPSTGRLTPVT